MADEKKPLPVGVKNQEAVAEIAKALAEYLKDQRTGTNQELAAGQPGVTVIQSPPTAEDTPTKKP